MKRLRKQAQVMATTYSFSQFRAIYSNAKGRTKYAEYCHTSFEQKLRVRAKGFIYAVAARNKLIQINDVDSKCPATDARLYRGLGAV
jgi:hypothetical protein